jgi:HlyD family secretion protein
MTNPSSNPNPDVAQTLGVGSRRSALSRVVRWLFFFVIVAACAAAGAYWLTLPKGESVRYVTQPAQRGDLVVTVSATGTLEPIKTVEVGIEVSGTIKTVDVDYNDQVEVGQVLAQLDTSKLEAQALQSSKAARLATS